MSEQIEIYSRGSTHTLYTTCGSDPCRRTILIRGFGIPSWEVDSDREVFEVEDARITVAPLDEPPSCIWCYGCGAFIQHGADDGGCECAERGYDPEADREPLRPMVHETGLLELRHYA